jgi:hypothetical protein
LPERLPKLRLAAECGYCQPIRHRIELSCRRNLHLRRYLVALVAKSDHRERDELYRGEAERAQRGVEMPRPGMVRQPHPMAEALLARHGFGSPAPARAAPAGGRRKIGLHIHI